MVIIVSVVMVIVAIMLASSSLSFFTFIVIIPPPPHDAISPLPLAPWPDGAVVVRSVHDNCTKNTILAKAMMMPAHADCQGQRQHCPIGIVLILEMSGIGSQHCLPLPSCLTLSTPPPILTVPSTMRPPLLLTIILFFPGSTPEGYLLPNPPFFCYSCEGHIIYHEKPQGPNFLLMKKIVIVSIVSRDYSDLFCNQR
jgi:hypothetical protein